MKSIVHLIATAAVAVTLLGGCAIVKLDSTWRDPNVSPKRYAKLLVVGVSEDADRRSTFESIFVKELKKRGVDAVPSFTVMSASTKPNRESVLAAVKASGATGVIATRIVDVKKVEGFVADYSMSTFDDYYIGSSASLGLVPYVQGGGGETTFTKAVIESKLFDAGTRRMVWAGTSSTLEGEEVLKVFIGLAEVVASSLQKDGFI